MSLLAELKRRNVFKVGAAYLALAWVVVQATGAIVPALNLPATLVPTVVWIGIIGFPCVLIFSWAYELTPEGLKRESEVDRSQSITHVTSKRLDYVIVGMLAVAIGLFVLQYLRPPRSESPATAEAVTPATSPAVQAEPLAAPQPVAAILPDDKSIAVLPFADMSQSKDQEYFSDGMSEELLNLLAKAPDLKVIARTSSFAFKGKDVPIAEIAKQLGVAHVLEGSVRKAGNKVRITAQLIRAADSTHVWSETYDRPLDDIFAVQDEIGKAIVQALQIRLAGGTLSPREGGTQNLEAYQLYLRSKSAMRSYRQSSLDAASDYASQSIKLDPNYGMAWYALAESVVLKTDIGVLAPVQGYERARQLAQHALQLSPDLADGHAMLQYVYHTLDWNWEAAETEGIRALAIDPGSVWALNATGILFRTLGRWDDAERQLHSALARDPRNPYVTYNLGYTYYLAGRFAESERAFRKLLELDSDYTYAHSMLAATLLAQGASDPALAMLLQAADEREQLNLLPIILQATGRMDEVDAALQAQIAKLDDNCATCVAQTYAYRGDHDLALQWLERAYQQKDDDLLLVFGEPLLKNIAHDPRFIAFLKKMNLPTEPVPVNWQ